MVKNKKTKFIVDALPELYPLIMNLLPHGAMTKLVTKTGNAKTHVYATLKGDVAYDQTALKVLKPLASILFEEIEEGSERIKSQRKLLRKIRKMIGEETPIN